MPRTTPHDGDEDEAMMVMMMLVHCNKFIAAQHPHHHAHTLNPLPLPSWLFQRAWCTARMHLQMQLQHAWYFSGEQPRPSCGKILWNHIAYRSWYTWMLLS